MKTSILMILSSAAHSLTQSVFSPESLLVFDKLKERFTGVLSKVKDETETAVCPPEAGGTPRSGETRDF